MAKSRLVYAFSLAFAWILALFFETDLAFALVYALLILPALSFITLLLSPLLIQVEQGADRAYLVKGDTRILPLVVVNKGLFFYPRVQLILSDSKRVCYSPVEAFSLGGRQRVEAAIAVTFPYRGGFTVGAEQMVLHDFMGLFRFSVSLGQAEPTVVYPKRAEAFNLPLTQEEINRQIARNSQIFAQPEEISDLRQYVPQDDSRKIHWKASVKRDQLIVKEYQGAAPQIAHLILDTRRLPKGGPAMEDYMTALGAAAVEDCPRWGLTPVLTCGPEGAPVSAKGTGGLLPAWNALARAAFDTTAGLETLLDRRISPHGGLGPIIVITARLEPEVLAALEGICAQGHALYLVYVHPPGLPPPAQLKGQLQGLEALGAYISLEEGPEEQG